MVKNTLCVLAVAMASNSVLAADSHWYFGVDALNTKANQKNTFESKSQVLVPAGTVANVPFPVTVVTTETDKISDLSSETGFGIHVGTQFLLASQFALAVEAEYLSFGSFSGNHVYTVTDAGVVSGVNVYQETDTVSYSQEVDVSATNLNIKPKYYFGGNNFYLGAIAGVGVYKVDLKLDDGSDWGFNYGVEAGYELTPELTFSAGYRMFTTSIDVKDTDQDFELELDSFYAGLDYKF